MFTVILACVLCFGAGFGLSRLGVWFRFDQIEADLRGLQSAAHELAMMEHSRYVPAEWVEFQVSDLLNTRFH